jgi:hypothetical protein
MDGALTLWPRTKESGQALAITPRGNERKLRLSVALSLEGEKEDYWLTSVREDYRGGRPDRPISAERRRDSARAAPQPINESPICFFAVLAAN